MSGTDASDIVNLFPTPYIETRQERMERVRKYIRTLLRRLCFVHRLLFPALSSCCILGLPLLVPLL